MKLTLTKTITIALLGLGVLVGAILFSGVTAFGNVTSDTASGRVSGYQEYTFFATTTNQVYFATTTTATSTYITPWTDANGRIDKGYFVVAGAKRATAVFSRGDSNGQGNAGSTLFKIQVTTSPNPSESDWQNYSKLISNVTNTNSQTLTRVANASIAAATSTTVVGIDLSSDSFYAIRCIAVETTDGEHFCKASADW